MPQPWTKQKVLDFVQNNPVLSIAVNGEETPISSIVLCYFDEELNFYFETGTDSHKTGALRSEQLMSFSVWEANVAIVQGVADAEEVTDETEIDRVMDRIVATSVAMEQKWPPLLNFWKDDYVLFKMKPRYMRILDMTEQTIKKTEGQLTEIVF